MDVTIGTAQLSFKVPYDVPSSGFVTWPDGQSWPVDLGQHQPHPQLTLRLPLPPATRQEARSASEGTKSEHRRTVRIDVSLPVQVHDLDATRKLVLGHTLNLSSGGAQVTSDTPLIVGRDYFLTMTLAEETEHVKARVVRRVGHNTYAMRFLVDAETGHRLMRNLFTQLRAARGPSKRSFKSFRKT